MPAPSPVDFTQIGLAGGFVFATAVLMAVLWMLFQAWRKAEFVSRPLHEEIVKAAQDREDRLTTTNQQLRDQLVNQASTIERLAGAYERLSYRSSQDPRP